MAKVYVAIHCGDWEDWRLAGVFSTHEKAKQHLIHLAKTDKEFLGNAWVFGVETDGQMAQCMDAGIMVVMSNYMIHSDAADGIRPPRVRELP